MGGGHVTRNPRLVVLCSAWNVWETSWEDVMWDVSLLRATGCRRFNVLGRRRQATIFQSAFNVLGRRCQGMIFQSAFSV